jgi:hypothetical protein
MWLSFLSSFAKEFPFSYDAVRGHVMNPRTQNILAIIIIAGVGLLFLINLRHFFFDEKQEGYLPQDNVMGVAIMHKKKPYTLNFDQQREVVELLNRSLSVGIKREQGEEKPDFDSLIIYLFNGGEIKVTPLSWQDQSLVFSAHPWQNADYFKDTSGGKLYELLKTTYDP